MPDNTTLNAGTGGDTIASDELAGGVKIQRVKPAIGADGVANDVAPVSAGMDVSGTTVPAAGMVAQVDDTAPSAVTENQFGPVRMSVRRALLVEGVAGGTAQPVSGPLTDAELRAVAVPVSGPLTDGQLRAAAVPVSGPLTDAQLRATAVPVSGPVTDAQLRATAVPVAGPLTDTQLRAAAVPVSDGGGSLTVDGTVELGAAALAALETITVASITAPLAAGDNNIGNVDVLTLPALPAGTNNIGDVDVLTLPAIPAGTNNIGNVGLAPRTAGGHTIHRTLSAASTNATSVKGAAGQLYGYIISNVNAAPRYLKLYNKATAPVVGTDAPALTILVPGNTSGVTGHVEFTNGIEFPLGIGFALTTGVADADTGAVAANELIVHLLYK